MDSRNRTKSGLQIVPKYQKIRNLKKSKESKFQKVVEILTKRDRNSTRRLEKYQDVKSSQTVKISHNEKNIKKKQKSEK